MCLCFIFLVTVNATLTPAPHVVPLQTQFSHLDIPVGQPIRLHFRIRGQPPPKVTWLQNDVEIVETEEVEVIFCFSMCCTFVLLIYF